MATTSIFLTHLKAIAAVWLTSQLRTCLGKNESSELSQYTCSQSLGMKGSFTSYTIGVAPQSLIQQGALSSLLGETVSSCDVSEIMAFDVLMGNTGICMRKLLIIKTTMTLQQKLK